MKKSNLIQRLQNPIDYINPFSFGGGFKNGGFSDKAMELISKICIFDYMGSSEFEFGAVPKSFKEIIGNKKEYIAGNFFPKFYYQDWLSKKEFSSNTKNVYYLCKKEDEKEVKTRISKWSCNSYNDTKEMILLDYAILNDKNKIKVCGWIELDNNFMFFTDKTMFDNFCTLFNFCQS